MGTWLRVVASWADTVREARRRPGDLQLTEKVNGEWSFIETLRHLVFVTDTWIGMGVFGSEVRHPLGLPQHFLTNGKELGLDLEIQTRFGYRAPRPDGSSEELREPLHAVGDDLGEPCLGPLSGFTNLGAFQVVIAEEWFHRAFAIRDLATLTGS